MSENLLNSSQVRKDLNRDLDISEPDNSDKELDISDFSYDSNNDDEPDGSYIELDISDFSSDSGSNNDYGPDDNKYETDDSPCLIKFGPICQSTQIRPRALSPTPGPSGHNRPMPNEPVANPDCDLSSESECDDVLVPVPTLSSVWTRVHEDEPKPDIESEFTVRKPGPRKCPIKHKPYEYFKLFVSDEMIVILVRESNIYAQKLIEAKQGNNKLSASSRYAFWKNVTTVEVRKYIAIILTMGICQRKNIEDYWSTEAHLYFPFIRQNMSLRRFEAISRVLHLSSRRGPAKGQPGFDPWLKIRPFLDEANNAFLKHYVPGQNLSLNENMIEMKNRSCFSECMPNKLHASFGIKYIELIDASTMYVVQVALYSGKDYMAERPDTFTQKVVLDLLERGRCLDKGYHVFIDNSYTTIPLAQQLLNKKTLLTGSVNKNSKGLPKVLISGQLAVMEPVYYRQDRLLVVGFKETPTIEPVFLMSTAYRAGQESVRNSHGREITKPVMIKKYNQFMGGEECKDKSLFHLSSTRPTKTYWKKTFYNLLDSCIQNAYVLYVEQCVDMGNFMTRSKFIGEIIDSLVVQAAPTQPTLPQTTFYQTLGAEHKLTMIPKKTRRVCGVCYKLASNWCPGCNCGVHRDCFSKIEHKYRPLKSRKRPLKGESDD